MRLQKYMAMCGVASRRKSEELIKEGHVKVNGNVIKDMGVSVDENKDKVTVDDKKIVPVVKETYYLLYKPRGYVSSCEDDRGRKTVLDLIKTNKRVYPVGRLDYNSEGLLILTNNGELANRMTHPKYKIKKTYKVTTTGITTDEQIEEMEAGIELDGKKTLPCEIELIKEENAKLSFYITIKEGRNRQVRRMVEAVGGEVHRLVRISQGPLKIKGLKPGEFRELNQREILELKKACGLFKLD